MSRRVRRLSLVALASTAMLATTTGAAFASSTPLGDTQILETAQSWQTCQDPLIEQPYSLFDDKRDYVLAPGGSFENATAPGWQLPPGASIVPGDDAFTEKGKLLTTHTEGSMLEMAKGTSVISPAMCVDLNYPLFRFTSRAITTPGDSGVITTPDDAEIRVEVVYPNAENPAFEQVTKFDGKQGDFTNARWHVSNEIDLKPDLGGQQWGGRLAALRFTVLSGTWRIDDVYVDPRSRS